NRFEAGVFTGKGLSYGGSLVRREATGYGVVYFTKAMLATRGDAFEGRRVTVSGSGNVAVYAMEKAIQYGAKIVACSDSSGYIHDEEGIDLDLIKEIKEVRRQRISEYVRLKKNGTHFIPSDKGS